MIQAAAFGRKLPLISVVFSVPERPLSGKAAVQILIDEKSARTSALHSTAAAGMVEC